jgi:hypothetical protein
MQTTVAAAPSGITLTQAGLAYCARHGREAIERRIDRHLALVTALLGYLDAADGDENVEASISDIGYPVTDDRECDMADDIGEATNEDGGDILDEPHDGDLDLREGEPWEDLEPSLGWGFAGMHQGQGYLAHGASDCDREGDLDQFEGEDNEDKEEDSGI